MDKPKTVLIASIVSFAIGAVLFLISLFGRIGDLGKILSWIGGAFIIVAIILVYVGTILKVRENNSIKK